MKHGIDFETALRVFGDLHYLLIKDRVDDEGEQRWDALGQVDGVALFVVHVYRSSKQDGEETIRIISARRANQRESRRYFEQAAF